MVVRAEQAGGRKAKLYLFDSCSLTYNKETFFFFYATSLEEPKIARDIHSLRSRRRSGGAHA